MVISTLSRCSKGPEGGGLNTLVGRGSAAGMGYVFRDLREAKGLYGSSKSPNLWNMGPIITVSPAYMGSHFCISLCIWVYKIGRLLAWVCDPLNTNLWDLYGALYHFHEYGVYFRKVSAILGLHFHEQQDFGVLLEEICIYGPIFWHLYTIFLGLTFCH